MTKTKPWYLIKRKSDIPAMKHLQDLYTRDLANKDAEIAKLREDLKGGRAKAIEQRDRAEAALDMALEEQEPLVAEVAKLSEDIKNLNRMYDAAVYGHVQCENLYKAKIERLELLLLSRYGYSADWYRSEPCTHPYLRFTADGESVCQRCGVPAEAEMGY